MPRIPVRVLTDNGPEFTSEAFGTLLERYNIVHVRTTPYKPSSNGAVERVNRTIGELLRILTCEPRKWDESLAKALLTYNHTLHSEIGCTPAEQILKFSHDVSSLPLLSAEMKHPWAKGHPRYQPFKIGSLVLKKTILVGNLTTNKLSPRFDGPYQVNKIHSNKITYDLTHTETGHSHKAHHVQLKTWHEPPLYLKNYFGRPQNDSDNTLPVPDSVVIGDTGCSRSDESDDSNSDISENSFDYSSLNVLKSLMLCQMGSVSHVSSPSSVSHIPSPRKVPKSILKPSYSYERKRALNLWEGRCRILPRSNFSVILDPVPVSVKENTSSLLVNSVTTLVSSSTPTVVTNSSLVSILDLPVPDYSSSILDEGVHVFPLLDYPILENISPALIPFTMPLAVSSVSEDESSSISDITESLSDGELTMLSHVPDLASTYVNEHEAKLLEDWDVSSISSDEVEIFTGDHADYYQIAFAPSANDLSIDEVPPDGLPLIDPDSPLPLGDSVRDVVEPHLLTNDFEIVSGPGCTKVTDESCSGVLSSTLVGDEFCVTSKATPSFVEGNIFNFSGFSSNYITENIDLSSRVIAPSHKIKILRDCVDRLKSISQSVERKRISLSPVFEVLSDARRQIAENRQKARARLLSARRKLDYSPPFTRSRGNAVPLPNVQATILERRMKNI